VGVAVLVLQPGDDTPIELYLDDILNNEEDKYEDYIKSKFEKPKQPVQAFIEELLSRIKELNFDRKSRDSLG
jgi:hypothetical protein